MISVGTSKGEGKHYKTVIATLGRHFYDRALPLDQQCIVDHAQGEQAHRLTSKMITSQPYWEIVDLIAIDPTIVVINRLINSFNKAVKCQRNKHESLMQLVSRFYGLASQHFIHGGLSSSSQVWRSPGDYIARKRQSWRDCTSERKDTVNQCC